MAWKYMKIWEFLNVKNNQQINIDLFNRVLQGLIFKSIR